MVSDYVMTQANCQSQRFAPEPIGLASYAMDSHALTRVAVGGFARVEGVFFVPVPQPYPISYRSIIPRAGECENLFCTFALSASHVAFASCRMEPVFMITSQSAATAAAFAIDDDVSAQQLSHEKLALQLRADGQLLDWVGGVLTTNGVIIDNGNPGAAQVGSWTSGANPGFWGTGYLHDQNSGKGTKSVRYTPNLPFSGDYDVFAWWVADPNRASNVPFDIIHARGTNRVLVNQTLNGSTWVRLFRTNFVAGQGGGVVIRNDNTSGYVVADAVRFMPVGNFTVPPPTVQIIAADPFAGEFGSNWARFSIVRDGDLTRPLTVDYSLGGSASNSVDYTALSGTVLIPCGALAGSIVVQPVVDGAIEGNETINVSLKPGAAYALGPLSNATAIIADKPIETWLGLHFTPAEQGDAAISGNEADPDQDGVPNLTEYALGLDPKTRNAGANGLPRAEIIDGYFTLTYTRLKAATDVAVEIEVSPDLTSWHSGPAYIEQTALSDHGDTQRITMRDRRPVKAASQGFLRLNVTLLPETERTSDRTLDFEPLDFEL
jgi:hypothetical protein